MINKHFSFSTAYCLAILLLAVGCSPKAESRQTATDNDEEKERQPSGETLAETEEDPYPLVFSDSSKGYTIVLKPDIGLVARNREGKTLYQVFMYDNGPDYPSDGYFRIVEKGKIGYADEETGEVRIRPQYAAARPFENGYAPICPACETVTDGEYSRWVNGKWGLIDKQGRVVVEPRFARILEIAEGGKALVENEEGEEWIEIK